MTRKASTPPLGEAGLGFWKAMHAEHDLDAAQEAVLARACRQLDVAEVFREKGTEGDRGRAVAQERLASEAFVRMVRSLDSLIRPKPKKPARPPSTRRTGADPRLRVAE